MAIIDMAAQISRDIRVVTIDTGRLPAETHEMIDRVRDRYQIDVEVYFPRSEDLEPLVRQHGANLFYESEALRARCCEVRKTLPLNRILQDFDAWVSGLRRDQASTRAAVESVEVDHDHGGVLKINPLAYWTDDQVWAYVQANKVPTHPLYAHGYTSIGCAPCTRAVLPGEDARAGRWWWEQSAFKECGLHFLPMGPDGAASIDRSKHG